VELLSLGVFSYLLFFCATEQQTLAKNTVKILQIDYKEPYRMFDETFAWMKDNIPPNSVVKVALTGSKFPYPGFYAADSMTNLEARPSDLRRKPDRSLPAEALQPDGDP